MTERAGALPARFDELGSARPRYFAHGSQRMKGWHR
jgi:hypothetical protein